MVQYIKHKTTLVVRLLLISVLALSVCIFIISTPASASIRGGVNCGGDKISLKADCGKPSGAQSKIEDLIKTIINIFSAVVGAISVIMIIIGGFRYVTSGGNAESISGAKKTILYAIVGLVIVAFAQIIVQFVLQRAT